MLGTIQGNIVDAQKSDQDKKAEAEAFEKRKEEAKEAAAEKVKNYFDKRWGPSWHVVIGKNFGSHCTHETKRFIYFYYGDKAVMVWRAGGVS